MAMKSLRSGTLETAMHSKMQMADSLDLLRLKAGQWHSMPDTQEGLARPAFGNGLEVLKQCMEDGESSLETIVKVAAGCLPDMKATVDFTRLVDIAAHYGEAWMEGNPGSAVLMQDIATLGIRLLGGEYVPDPLRFLTLVDPSGAKKDPFYARLGFKKVNLELFSPFEYEI